MTKLFEITATARSEITERWRVKASSPEEAMHLFSEGEAEFIADEITGEAEGRKLVNIAEVERNGTGKIHAVGSVVSLDAVRLVRELAKLDRRGDPDLEPLIAKAKQIAERLS